MDYQIDGVKPTGRPKMTWKGK